MVMVNVNECLTLVCLSSLPKNNYHPHAEGGASLGDGSMFRTKVGWVGRRGITSIPCLWVLTMIAEFDNQPLPE